MSPQAKAFELVKKFNPYTASITQKLTLENARGAALVAVEEIIKSWDQYREMEEQEVFSGELLYWYEVKAEIKKI